MRGLLYYFAAFTALLLSAAASVAAEFVAPIPARIAQETVVQPVATVGGAAVQPESTVPAVQPQPVIAAEAPKPATIAQQGFVAPSPLAANPLQQAAQVEVVEAAAEPEPEPELQEQAVSTPTATANQQPIAAVRVPEKSSEQAAWGGLQIARNVPNAAPDALHAGLTFQEALKEAYLYNPRLVAERERQKGTDEQVAQAISGFRPNASISIDRGRQRTSFNGAGRNYGDSDRTDFRVEQPIFRGGGTIAGYQSAKQQVKAGKQALIALEQQVLFDTIEAFMDVVQSQSILEIARNNESVLREQLKASQERFDVGEVTRTDVAQSEARLSNASAQVIEAEGELISAVASLENLIDKKPSSALVAPEHLPEVPAQLDNALEIARAQNPQLLRAVHAEKSAKYEVRRNVASILPSATLVGSVSKQEGAGVLGTTQFNQDALRLNITVPLYQSGAEYSRVRQAKALKSQRKFEVMNTRLAVDAVVTQAWEALETSIATIAARRDQIKAAEVALDGVKQEQLYGARTVLDVLDAEQELFVARSNLVRAERDRVVALFSLLQSLGHLTPGHLELDVPVYDADENLDRVKWLPIGF